MLPKTAKDTKDSQSRLDFFLMHHHHRPLHIITNNMQTRMKTSRKHAATLAADFSTQKKSQGDDSGSTGREKAGKQGSKAK